MASSAGGVRVLVGREGPGDKGKPMWPLQRTRLAKGLIEKLALEVSSGHHTFPEHWEWGVE